MAPVKEIRRFTLAHGELCISKGSVIDFGEGKDWDSKEVALVNAANTGGIFGGGVDRAFVVAGGERLAHDRHALPVLQGSRGTRIPFGGAVTTGPETYGTLRGAYVIHAVGPDYVVLKGRRRSTEGPDRLLRDAYTNAVAEAERAGVKYLGFSLLSAGVFRGACSLDHVLGIAVDALAAASYEGLREVHLIAFLPRELEALLNASEKIFAARAGL